MIDIYGREWMEEEYLNLYNELRANTRTWEDRGHTADEIEDLYYSPQKYREFISSMLRRWIYPVQTVHRAELYWWDDFRIAKESQTCKNLDLFIEL